MLRGGRIDLEPISKAAVRYSQLKKNNHGVFMLVTSTQSPRKPRQGQPLAKRQPGVRGSL